MLAGISSWVPWSYLEAGGLRIREQRKGMERERQDGMVVS